MKLSMLLLAFLSLNVFSAESARIKLDGQYAFSSFRSNSEQVYINLKSEDLKIPTVDPSKDETVCNTIARSDKWAADICRYKNTVNFHLIEMEIEEAGEAWGIIRGSVSYDIRNGNGVSFHLQNGDNVSFAINDSSLEVAVGEEGE
jgi:hypothetical protein